MASGWQPDELVSAWDDAAGLIEHDPSRVLRYRKCFRYFVERVGTDAPICDVGCGEGSGLLLLQRLGFTSLSGLEVSPTRIEQARRLVGGGVRLSRVAPDAPMPFSDDTFEVVISAAVVEHTLDPGAHIRELARITRPGGSVVIASDCYTFRILELLGLYRTVQPVDRTLSPLTLLRYFAASHLELVHSEGFPASSGPYLLLRSIVHATHLRDVGRRVLPSAVQRGIRRLVGSVARPEEVVEESAALEAPLEPWRPNHWLRALPKVTFSEENVFYLVKPRVT